MRITDQYIWNVVFLVFFATLVFLGTIILGGEAYKDVATLTFVDYALMVLASFRVTRLVVYDLIFAFFREQFLDVKETRSGFVYVKPEGGPRRTISDLLLCPWCFGMWASATVTFFYLLTPYAFYPVLLLAIGGVATFLQLLANMVGWKAEQLKQDVELK